MSQAYSLEPQTEGKVIIYTTRGEVAIELWAKECPKAVRNFVQLAMEGFYDGQIFHRVIKDFMIQTGDPTGTGSGPSESIYGGEFRDEIHSRLRFSHRGLLAMASSGPNTNGSQFFITLGKCDWLNGKHTIFGRISGDSIYNALKISECDVDDNDRPITGMTTIKTIEVLWNPFDDCFPRASKAPQPEIVDLAAERKAKKKQKNMALLSFGDEQQEADTQVKEAKKKMGNKSKSAHDDDATLSKEVDDAVEEASKKLPEDTDDGKKQLLRQKVLDVAQGEAPKASTETASQMDFAARMRKQIAERQARLGVAKESGKKSEKQLERAQEQRMEEMIEYTDSDEEEEEQPKKSALSLKKIRRAKEGAAENDAFKISGDQSGADRRDKRKMKAEVQSREKATLDKLKGFQATLQSSLKTQGEAPVVEAGLDAASAGKKRKLQKEEFAADEKKPANSWLDAESEEEESEDDDSWMNHKLTFERTAADRRKERADMAGLLTIDPREAKGKDGKKKNYDNRSQHERRLKPGVRKQGDGRW